MTCPLKGSNDGDSILRQINTGINTLSYNPARRHPLAEKNGLSLAHITALQQRRVQSVDKYLVPASLYLSDDKSRFPGYTKRHVSLRERRALIPVMAERLWQTDSINQALLWMWKCHPKSNWILCFGAAHTIMESIKCLWCWKFYCPPRWMHPHHTKTIICKIFEVLKIQFDWWRDESGMEMCSLEFTGLRPATWTSKLQAITMIIWMMFDCSLVVDTDMSNCWWRWPQQTHAENMQMVRR